MKVFQNKTLFKKIIIVLLIVIVSSFFFSGKVNAKDDTFGGKLLSPIADLFNFLGDGTLTVVHRVMFDQQYSTISIDRTNGIWDTLAAIGIGLLVGIVIAIAIVATAGAAAAVVAALGGSLAAVSAGTVLVISVAGGVAAAAYYKSTELPDVMQLPIYQISPEEIFSNEILMFDVDFFNPKEDQQVIDPSNNIIVYDEDHKPVIRQSTAKQLREVISNWYRILRDIAIVALLSILVYVGIRIIISSTASDKSKYKQILTDWVVAICLLFVMQYIMSFSNLIVGKVTQVISDGVKGNLGYISVIEDEDGKIEEGLKTIYSGDVSTLKEGNLIVWPTNLLGKLRIDTQIAKDTNSAYAGYTLMFVVLVLFTLYFIVTYLKRVLYMAFLTIIAPLVAMTYPIDKMNDGKAQAFNMWFKEYIFNLLIQPLHLLLYTILVSSAFELASKNVIYSLVALGFMIPAEKIMRSFFGFEKAKTPGLLAGPAGAALMMNGMHRLLGRAPKDVRNNSKSNKSDFDEGALPPRTDKNFDKDAVLNFDNDNSGGNPPEIDPPGGDLPGGDPPGGDPPGINPPGGDQPGGDPPGINPPGGDQSGGDPPGINPPEGDQSGINPPRSNTQGRNNNGKLDNLKRKLKNVPGAIGRGAVATTKYYGRSMKRQLKNSIKNAHPLKAATRFAAGAAGAATLGAAGLAIGITSGDLTKAAQYTATGVLGGYKMGTGIKGSIDSLTPEGLDEVAQRSAYNSNDEYKQAQQEKYIKQYQENEKNMFELERKYGAKEAKRIMKDDIPVLLNNGITNMDDITTIEDAIKDSSVPITTLDEGIAIKKYASMIGSDSTKLTKKKRDEWNTTFQDRFAKNSRYNGQNHKELSDQLFKKIDAYNKIRYQDKK